MIPEIEFKKDEQLIDSKKDLFLLEAQFEQVSLFTKIIDFFNQQKTEDTYFFKEKFNLIKKQFPSYSDKELEHFVNHRMVCKVQITACFIVFFMVSFLLLFFDFSVRFLNSCEIYSPKLRITAIHSQIETTKSLLLRGR